MSSTASVLAASEVASLAKYIDLRSAEGQQGTDFKFDGRTSLLDTQGDKFVAYNHARNSICLGNVRDLHASSLSDHYPLEEEIKLKQALPFKVNRLSLHPGSRDSCILWGDRGLAMIGFGHAGSDKLQITQEKVVAEKMYADHKTLTVVQCKWVPTMTHKIILVLSSDSFLRVYNVDTTEALGVFNFGPPECMPLMTKFAAEVDPETPVDFDFGPYFSKTKSWTVFVLKLRGNIYCALLGLVGTNIRCMMDAYRPVRRLEGDENTNRDEEFSCILCSKQFPVVIVSGQETGQITHFVLLPASTFEDYEEEEDMEGSLLNNRLVLYKKERLKLQLPGEDSASTMRLLLDPLFDERYICVHGSGVHLVNMKFLPEMVSFFQADESKNLSSLTPSVCRLLILWNVGKSMKTKTTNKILGVSFTESQPQKLVCVLQDKRTVIYSMPHPNDLHDVPRAGVNGHQRSKLPQDSNNLFSKKNSMQIARNLLRGSGSQPFFCSDQDAPKSEFVKLAKSTLRLKCDQIDGIDDGTEYLMKYISSIEASSDEMKGLVSKLLNTRGGLKVVAESIAEHYEERAEQDEILTKRLEKILFQYHQAFPFITDKEKAWQQALNEMKLETDRMKDSVNLTKVKLAQLQSQDRNFEVKLQAPQIQQIKEEIKKQHFYITTLTAKLREINKKLALG